MVNVTPEQILHILQQRATTDRLIAEILRACALEAHLATLNSEEPEEVTDDP